MNRAHPGSKRILATPRTARRLAWDILNQVDRHGAWAEELLPPILAGAGLNDKENRFCRELVFGTMKSRLFLDYVIAPCLKSKKPPQAEVMNLLRLGVYQLLLLSKVPAHAAVHEMVDLAKTAFSSAQAGFVNALLREVIRQGPRPLPDQGQDPVAHLSIRYSFPAWIAKRWLDRFGLEAASGLMAAANEPPPLVLRVNSMRSSREAVAQNLARRKVETEPLAAPMALRATNAGDPAKLPGFAEGHYYFQDQASQWVGYIVDPQPGQTCLDICSAPGGKATQLAELMGDLGKILAWDRNAPKLRRVAENAARLGLQSLVLLPQLSQARPADRVLVDAPCSNLGTLRRHAEARYRLQEKDLARLAAEQLKLVTQAAEYVKIGGTLVYATCTTEPEENEEVVKRFLQTHPHFGLQPGPGHSGWPPPEFWQDDCFRTYPQSPEDDGIFAARMLRRE